MPKRAHHGDKGEAREDSQEDIVDNDKGEEYPRLANGPRLIPAFAIGFV